MCAHIFIRMVTHALSARLPVFLGTKVPERNLQKPSLHVYTKFIFFYDDVTFTDILRTYAF